MAVNPKSLENLDKGRFKRNSREKQQKIARMGGKASGVAKRENAKAKEIVKAILSSPVIDDKAKAQLEELGLPNTIFVKVLLGAVQKSEVSSDMLRIILELTGDMSKEQNNVTVNAVPIIIGGENELK